MYVIGRFTNTFPCKCDKQKQMLEEREDRFSHEAVASSVQKWFEPSAYKQMRRIKKNSVEDQTLVVTGGDKTHPGRGGSRHGGRTLGESQGGRGNSGSGRGGGGGDSSGGGTRSCSSSATTATAKPGRRTFWVSKRLQHYVCDCPKQICQGCGKRGHQIIKCGKTEYAVMAVDMPGKTSTSDDSPVSSEAELEVYATPEIKTRERLDSIEENEGATGHFTYDPSSLEKLC